MEYKRLSEYIVLSLTSHNFIANSNSSYLHIDRSYKKRVTKFVNKNELCCVIEWPLRKVNILKYLSPVHIYMNASGSGIIFLFGLTLELNGIF